MDFPGLFPWIKKRRKNPPKNPRQFSDQNLGVSGHIFQRNFKNLLMPLFLMGCFPVGFQEVKRPLRMKSGKRPIKVGKRPIKEGKRPIKAMVLVGISVGCLMGCFRAPPPWRKTAPLKRPIKRSMSKFRGKFRSKFRRKFRKLRFKFRDFFRKLRSAEGRC